MKRDVEESRETRWDTSVAMSDDDEPLITKMTNRGKPIIRRKPKPIRIIQFSHPPFRRKISPSIQNDL